MSLVDGGVFLKLRLPRMQRTWARSRAKDNFRLSQLSTIGDSKFFFCSKLFCQKGEEMLCFSSTATIGAEDDRCERAVLHFDNPLVVLSLIFPFIGVEATVQSLTSMCRGVRVKNPDIEKCLFTSLPKAPSSYVDPGLIARIRTAWKIFAS